MALLTWLGAGLPRLTFQQLAGKERRGTVRQNWNGANLQEALEQIVAATAHQAVTLTPPIPIFVCTFMAGSHVS
eukprot:1488570-Amphidinium_carterae.1